MSEKIKLTEQEAIEAIKSNMPTGGYVILREALDMAIKALEEIQQYRAIGTIDECKEARSRQEPKVVTDTGDEDCFDIRCPNCNADLFEEYEKGGTIKFCKECGQTLDWGEAK